MLQIEGKDSRIPLGRDKNNSHHWERTGPNSRKTESIGCGGAKLKKDSGPYAGGVRGVRKNPPF